VGSHAGAACAPNFAAEPIVVMTALLNEQPAAPAPAIRRPWQWPLPPAGAYAPVPPYLSGTPCSVESLAGSVLQGVLHDFDPATRRLQLRAASGGPEVSLPFVRQRRVVLGTPLQLVGARARRGAAAGSQERSYRLTQVGDPHAPVLDGCTIGHVDAPEGLYLFEPTETVGELRRVFVPRAAYSSCEFGPSAVEAAALHWIASPGRLLEAIAGPQHANVLPLRQALLALGLVTPARLERCLAAWDGKAGLGESLVQAALVSKSDLQTALAHRMGFPLVDLARFPVDPAAQAMLPPAVAVAHRVLPLLRDQERLIVAVDRPGRVLKLRRLDAYAQWPIVPVLALKAPLLSALDRDGAGAAWSDEATDHMDLVDPTA
jgi:hypothetical protein